MKSFFSAAVLSFVMTLPVLADPKSDISFIVEKTVTRALFEGALKVQRPLIISALENDFRKKNLVINDSETFFDLFVDEWIDAFTLNMQERTGAIYRDLFSDQELADIAAFYRTDSGLAMIRQSPALMQAGAEIGGLAGAEAAEGANKRLAARMRSENITIDSPSVTQQLLDILE